MENTGCKTAETSRIDPNTLDQDILNLMRAFIDLPMSEHRVQLVKAVFKPTDPTYLFNLCPEIKQSSEYLLNLEDETDLQKSSRWFREQGSMQDRKQLIEKGFLRYHKFSTSISSVTVANYIKTLLRDIPGGLIPSACQELLIDLLKEKESNNY